MSDTKVCTKCGSEKPLSDFYKDSTGKMGVRADCKECVKLAVRTYAQGHVEEIRGRNRLYDQKNKEKRHAYAIHYRQENSERNKKRCADYYAKHKEQLNHRRRQYYEKKRTEILMQKSVYYRKNKDKHRSYYILYRRRNAKDLREYHTAYRLTDHGNSVRSAAHQRRRAQKRELPHDWTLQDVQRMTDYFHGNCAVCGNPTESLFTTQAADHWIPLSKGGPTVPTNMIPLCHSLPNGTGGCNNSKRDCDPVEWLIKTYGKKRAVQVLKRVNDYFDWVREQDADRDYMKPQREEP